MTDEARTEVLDIEGMTCASCVSRVERKLDAIDGVTAQVSLATESARVSYPADLDRAELTRAVDAAGSRAHLRRPAPEVGERREPHGTHAAVDHSEHAAMDHIEHHAAISSWPRVIASAILAVPVLVLGMVPAWQFPGWQWVSFALATPVVLWGGWPFHSATLKNLRHGAVTMDTLVTLGTLAAYLWSVWALVFGGAGRIGMSHGSDPGAEVYFEVAAVVTVFLLVGRAIEDRARRRAAAALRALLDLGARDVELADGRRIPTDRLLIGDEFVVRQGETIATDGVVQDGHATVDESMLTGESVPAEVAAGSEVTGGTLAPRQRVLGVRLQRRRAAPCRPGPAQPDDRRCRHGVLQRVSRAQQPAPATRRLRARVAVGTADRVEMLSSTPRRYP